MGTKAALLRGLSGAARQMVESRDIEIDRLRKALKETEHFFLGHFDDSCEECRRGYATIKTALGEKD